jgi:hypothetical protein
VQICGVTSRKTLIAVIIVVARHIFRTPPLASKMLLASKINGMLLLEPNGGVRTPPLNENRNPKPAQIWWWHSMYPECHRHHACAADSPSTAIVRAPLHRPPLPFLYVSLHGPPHRRLARVDLFDARLSRFNPLHAQI